jgi:hypothetical protein
VVVLYDGLPYPGVVKDVDENDLEVKVTRLHLDLKILIT